MPEDWHDPNNMKEWIENMTRGNYTLGLSGET